MEIFQDIRTWRFWRNFLLKSFACLGGLSTLLQTSNVINPTVTIFQGTSILCLVVVISLVGGIIWSWPSKLTQDYKSPKTKISIIKGDIFTQTTHLVIGTNDTFDTEPPIIISKHSLQGKALERLYGGDLKELDSQIANALTGKPSLGNIVKAGKQTRYGIGTIATLKHASRLIFFLAYAEMDAYNTAHSTPDKVWKSLGMLWDEVSKRSNGGAVSIPVIGGGQARLSSILPAQDAIRLTALSFMFASRESKVCDELKIIVSPDDYKNLDRLELQAFLSSLRSS
jgi:hypothetical protein